MTKKVVLAILHVVFLFIYFKILVAVSDRINLFSGPMGLDLLASILFLVVLLVLSVLTVNKIVEVMQIK